MSRSIPEFPEGFETRDAVAAVVMNYTEDGEPVAEVWIHNDLPSASLHGHTFALDHLNQPVCPCKPTRSVWE